MLGGAGIEDRPVSGDETIADPGDEYAWLIETSDDGDTWLQEHHPVHGTRDSGGIERGPRPEDLAREVLARRFALLRGDDRYAWEELWFRVIVWDFRACADYAGCQQPPYLPEQAQVDSQNYGRYLQVHRAEPHAVEVRVPRQVRAAVSRASTVP